MKKTIIINAEDERERIFNHSDDLICTAGMDGYFKYLNPAWKRILGYSIDKLLSRPFLDFIHPDDHEKSDVEFQKLSAGKKTMFFENRFICKNGSVRHFQWTATPLPDERKIFAIGHDMTEWKQVEKELRYKAELLENVSDAVVSTDNDFNIVSWNRAAEVLYGWQADEVIGKAFDRVVPVKYVDTAKENVSHQLRIEGHWQGETIQQNKNGDAFHMRSSMKVLKDLKGNPTGAVAINCNITECRQTEQALLDSEERFRTLFESTREGLISTGPDGRIVSVNPAAAKMLGYDRPRDLVGMKTVEFYADIKQREVVLKELETNDYIEDFEFTTKKRDGKKLYALASITIQRNDNGDYIRADGIFRDITERKQTEVALKISENKYRQLVELAQEGICQIDENSITTFVNPSMAGILGYTEAEMMGRHLFSFMDERGKEIAQNNIERRQRGVAGQHDFEFIKKDGTRIYTTMETAPITDEQGNYKGALAGVIDISKHVQAEASLKVSEELHRSVLNSISDSVYITANKGNFTFVCQNVDVIFGHSKEEIEAMGNIEKLFGKNIYSKDELKQKGEIVNIEKSIVDKTGVLHHLILNVKQVQIGQGEILYSCRDITERKQAEQNLKNSRNQLRRLAQKLETVREEERIEIAREIHDALGQNLTALQIDLSLVKKKLPENDKKIQEIASSMSEQIKILSKSVQQISMDLRPKILDDLGLLPAIKWQTDEFQKKTGIKCQLTLNIKEKDIDLDRHQLSTVYRICQETLTNIIRHAEATLVKVVIEEQDGHLILKVEDNGKGISKEQINSADSLGIIGIKERCLSCGGEMNIGGGPGKGTWVTVTIPAG
jgi:PAS domain S-box-containing protein